MFLWPAVNSTIFCFNNKPSSLIIRCVVSCIQSSYILFTYLSVFVFVFNENKSISFYPAKLPFFIKTRQPKVRTKLGPGPLSGPLLDPYLDPLWTPSGPLLDTQFIFPSLFPTPTAFLCSRDLWQSVCSESTQDENHQNRLQRVHATLQWLWSRDHFRDRIYSEHMNRDGHELIRDHWIVFVSIEPHRQRVRKWHFNTEKHLRD